MVRAELAEHALESRRVSRHSSAGKLSLSETLERRLQWSVESTADWARALREPSTETGFYTKQADSAHRKLFM